MVLMIDPFGRSIKENLLLGQKQTSCEGSRSASIGGPLDTGPNRAEHFQDGSVDCGQVVMVQGLEFREVFSMQPQGSMA